MPFVAEKQEQWSKIGLRIGMGSVVAVFVLSILDGILRGPFLITMNQFTLASMWLTWLVDLRYMCEQLMYVGAIVFIGAKFIETRTIFTVGFAKLDSGRVQLKGPDGDNIVWIGQRYDSAVEAATVAEAIKSRLDDGQVA
jgi:hypothetical protein